MSNLYSTRNIFNFFAKIPSFSHKTNSFDSSTGTYVHKIYILPKSRVHQNEILFHISFKNIPSIYFRLKIYLTISKLASSNSIFLSKRSQSYLSEIRSKIFSPYCYHSCSGYQNTSVVSDSYQYKISTSPSRRCSYICSSNRTKQILSKNCFRICFWFLDK